MRTFKVGDSTVAVISSLAELVDAIGLDGLGDIDGALQGLIRAKKACDVMMGNPMCQEALHKSNLSRLMYHIMESPDPNSSLIGAVITRKKGAIKKWIDAHEASIQEHFAQCTEGPLCTLYSIYDAIICLNQKSPITLSGVWGDWVDFKAMRKDVLAWRNYLSVTDTAVDSIEASLRLAPRPES